MQYRYLINIKLGGRSAVAPRHRSEIIYPRGRGKVLAVDNTGYKL